jgi:Clr5 domain
MDLGAMDLGAMDLRHTIDRPTETSTLDALAPFFPPSSADSATESITTSTSQFQCLDTPPPLQKRAPNCPEELETRAKPDEDDWEIHKPFIEQLYIEENLKLRDVMQILEIKFDFKAT